MTSELSDALNPYAAQNRTRNDNVFNHFLSPPQPVVQQPRPYVPHRSELELAITEPPSPLPLPPPPPQPRPQPRPESINVNAVQEIFRVISTTKEANELERKRRLAWEQEQEAKHAQREADLERRIVDMQQEIASLKAYVAILPSLLRNSSSGAPLQPQIEDGSSIVEAPTSEHLLTPVPQPAYLRAPPPQRFVNPTYDAVQPATQPLSPISQPPSRPQPLFVEGSSTRPFLHGYYSDLTREVHDTVTESSPSVSSSPQFQRAVPPPRESETPSSIPSRRRRVSPDPPDGDDEASGNEGNDAPPGRPVKRVSHRDTRILTIHHAIRHQILRSMGLQHDQELPENHIEGAPLGPSDPVRFVWLKTIRQSDHNLNMRKRVLEELKANRNTHYKFVPDSEFNDKTLETVFDQAFTTFRQKFKAQKDTSIAQRHRAKESNKATKARRHGRKKAKLATRVDARKRIEVFGHETFDGAFQVECMSSEDSMDEDTHLGAPRVQDRPVLRVHGLLWRSTRLQRFFTILDEDDRMDKNFKPKRGVGRRERCIGPPREGMPPKGVASWMISRRWLRTMELSQPHFSQMLKDTIVDQTVFDWEQFRALGEESEDEYEPQDFGLQPTQSQYTPIPYQDTSYSLQYALAPVS